MESRPRPLPNVRTLVRPPGAAESLLRWLPVLGWVAASLLRRSRLTPAVAAARAALLARGPVPAWAWGPDPARQEFARFLCETIAREAGWPAAHFVPDDPMATLCRLGTVHDTGGAVALAVGDRLHRRIPTREWDWLERLTLGAVVEELLPQAGRRCAACDYDLTANQTGVCPECGTPNGQPGLMS